MLTTDDHLSHGAMAHLDLMPVDHHGTATMATHVAISDGDWFDPATWDGGAVPGHGALVHIPQDVSITYDGTSGANLFMVRVDGTLTVQAANGAATKMIVDTMITSQGSSLKIEASDPSDGTVDIVFAEATPAAHQAHFSDASADDGVVGRYAWDPEQLSLGLVASGTVEIHGQHVDAGAQLAQGPAAGATELIFDAPLADSGWQVGQTLVIGGTSFLGRGADGKLATEDEVREITAIDISGGQMIVTLDRPLDYDHVGPSDPSSGHELTGYVGNLSRNVTISSAVADGNGDGAPDRGVSLGDTLGTDEHHVTERGHVMFMHNDDVAVTDAAFFGLGRTDKSRPVDDFVTTGDQHKRVIEDLGVPGQFDPETDSDIRTDPVEMLNSRGRYAIHIHEAGHSHHCGAHDGVVGPCPETGGPICHCGNPDGDQDNDGVANALDGDAFDGAYLEGNVVWGSPGWGFVQHSSAGKMVGNIAYDVGGAAFVAEGGDETGLWQDNLAIGTYGFLEKQDNQDSDNFNADDGAEGVGFYLKSRTVDLIDNAAQSAGRGYYYHTSGVDLRDADASAAGGLDGIARGRDQVPVTELPIGTFDGNDAIAVRQGLRIASDPHNSVRQLNDAWSRLEDFTAWAVDEAGVSVTYASKLLFDTFLILGTDTKVSGAAGDANSGFLFRASVADVTVRNSHVESFQNAVTNWTQIGDRQEYRRGYWDPKDPAGMGLTEATVGLGAVDGIENVAHNLWNTNIVGLTHADIAGVVVRSPGFEVETAPDQTTEQRGILVLNSEDDAGTPGASIELLGDSRDGGLVALWREDIAKDPDQLAMLAQHTPLSYGEAVHLGQVELSGGQSLKRESYLDYVPGINADIWSGTVLEFAKEDSLGRQVFLYGDFSPLDPESAERAVTTNERLVLSKDMIDATLIETGYYTVAGIGDLKFIIVEMPFTDRLTGDVSKQSILVALDTAWQLPVAAKDAGLLLIDDALVVAPQYRIFENGVLDQSRAPIVLSSTVPAGLEASDVQTGRFATDGVDDIRLGAAADSVDAGGGDDVIRGFAAADRIEGGAGNDALFGGDGWDRLSGGDGDDLLDGHLKRDILDGGAGDDRLQGGIGRDELRGGSGNDTLLAGNGEDSAFGGAGDDVIEGGNGKDRLEGGAGSDQLSGGIGFDDLYGGAGDDVLSGNSGNDKLYGGDGQDLLNGGARADEVFGGNGADLLLGDAGADRLFGEAGIDILRGQTGSDKLYGGTEDDVLSGGAGQDSLFGGDGADRLHGDQGNDRLNGGAGADKFMFEQGAGDDVIEDFEDGVDAIEFMIQSFGYDDLSVIQDGADAVITHHQGATLRLIETNASDLDQSDFAFLSPG